MNEKVKFIFIVYFFIIIKLNKYIYDDHLFTDCCRLNSSSAESMFMG